MSEPKPLAYQLTKKLLDSGQQCRLFFLGDSITSAEWIHPNWREIVEYVLKQHFEQVFSDYRIPVWNIRCFNAGFDGSTTRDITRLVPDFVVPHSPSIVLYQLGSNDTYANISDAEYAQNIRETLALLQAENSQVLLMSDLPSGYPHHNQIYQTRRTVLRETATETGIPFLDLYSFFEGNDITSFFSLTSEGNADAQIEKGEVDLMHPNLTGNAHLAKAILEKFFGVAFDAEEYLQDTKNSTVFYPSF